MEMFLSAVHERPQAQEIAKNLVNTLAAACSTVSAKLFDHIIITSAGYLSFKESGLL